MCATQESKLQIRAAWSICLCLLIALFSLAIPFPRLCNAQSRHETIVVHRLRVERDGRPFSTSIAPEKNPIVASDLIAAERFLAAPVRGDMLLTTYDFIYPIGDFEFYLEIDGKIVELKLWAADPWMNLAIVKSSESLFEPCLLDNGALISKNEMVYVGSRTPKTRTNEKAIVEFTGLQARSSSSHGVLSVHEFGDLVGVKSSQFLRPGAPLFTADGELLLIATGVFAESQKDISLCIALDSPSVKAVSALIAGEPLAYGFLGLEPANVSELPGGVSQRGVYARQVTKYSPADQGGVREENPRTGQVDVISKINGTTVESSQQLLSAVGRLPFGEKVQLTIQRGKLGEALSPIQIECTLAKRFASPLRPFFSQKSRYSWRGLVVDHFTAIDDFAARARLVDPKGCVAIVFVDTDSSAWKAGLRPGQFLTQIGESRIKNESDFVKVTSELAGPVKLTTTAKSDGLRLEPEVYDLAP